jgi:hypothetical protein
MSFHLMDDIDLDRAVAASHKFGFCEGHGAVVKVPEGRGGQPPGAF